MTPLEGKIAEILRPAFRDMGYRLMLVSYTSGQRARLVVMADRLDGRSMRIDDCTEISHTASALLDVEDPIVEPYALEVTSPGADRPLLCPQDFEKYAGFEVKVKTKSVGAHGRRNYRGRFQATNETIEIEVDGETYTISYDDIETAKLAVTDDLIDFLLEQQQKEEQEAGA